MPNRNSGFLTGFSQSLQGSLQFGADLARSRRERNSRLKTLIQNREKEKKQETERVNQSKFDNLLSLSKITGGDPTTQKAIFNELAKLTGVPLSVAPKPENMNNFFSGLNALIASPSQGSAQTKSAFAQFASTWSSLGLDNKKVEEITTEAANLKIKETVERAVASQKEQRQTEKLQADEQQANSIRSALLNTKAFAGIDLSSVPLATLQAIQKTAITQKLKESSQEFKAKQEHLEVKKLRDKIKFDERGQISPEGLIKVNNDLQKSQLIRDFTTVNTNFKSIEQAVATSSKDASLDNLIATDQAIVTLFNKVLDPGSTVRMAEFLTTVESQSVWNRFLGSKDKVLKGGVGFTESDRKELLRLAGLIRLSSGKSAIRIFDSVAENVRNANGNIQGLFNPFTQGEEEIFRVPAIGSGDSEAAKLLGEI